MMSPNVAQQSMQDLLEQEVRCTELLLKTLATERTALTERNVAVLETTTNDKIKYYQKLESLAAQRTRLVSELGFKTDRAGVELCFESLPGTDQIIANWHRIASNIEKCRNSNLVNGSVLEAGRQQVEQALGILRGQGDIPGVYTPNGMASGNLGHRKLGEV
ncbi:MAG: flagellar protein FlgN [Thiogranum sp.]|nr:flagellar protein FlgN [Thiogranum sp.]